MTRRARQRLRIALVVVFCLLFQQVALAGYACTLTQVPAEPTAMPGCAEMGMQAAKTLPASALCQKHCAPDHSITVDHASPTVPTLALAPLVFDHVYDQPRLHTALVAAAPISRSDPPPRLRYCSLLI